MSNDGPLIVHANAVAVQGRGLLILGASGSGKSGLSLQLMALGARLIADDKTIVTRQDAELWLSAPQAIRGMIEARGIGLLHASPADPTPLFAVLDLDQPETERLPPYRQTLLLGLNCPLLHNSDAACFPAGLMQYLREGRKE